MMPHTQKLPPANLSSGAKTGLPELLRLHKPEAAQHCVQFYERDFSLIQNIAYLAARTLEAGDSCVLIATEAHLSAVAERLQASRAELKRVCEEGRYVALDAAQTLERLLLDGFPDQMKFEAAVGGIIRDAVKNSRNGFVFAFGEMVALLCAQHKPDAALGLEKLWNAIMSKHRFSLCCAYSLDCFGTEPDLNMLLRICSEHSLAVPAETLL